MLAVLVMPAVAWAGKPTIAILGLEVVDPQGQVDATTTQVAKELTDGLRARANIGSSPYQIAAGSDKELLDEKLIKNCDSEAVTCMSQIGKDLGADYLLYGRIEKKGDGYDIILNLLNVGKKKAEKNKVGLRVTFAQRDAKQLPDIAKKAYNDMTGVLDAGTLVVTTNITDGTVYLNDENKGTLVAGSLTVDGLSEGRYRLVVDSNGKRSAEQVITIRSGESTPAQVTMAGTGPIDNNHQVGGTISETHGNAWKPVFWGALVVGVAGGGFSVYSYTRSTHYGDMIPKNNGLVNGASDCGKSLPDGTSYKSNFDTACSWHTRELYSGIGAGVVGAFAAFSFYMAYLRSDNTEQQPVSPTALNKKRRTMTVTPVVSAEGGGATFQLDW
ncbi:MAG TPA: PEGA domain-containing protein [Kofleriaceae bacterium]